MQHYFVLHAGPQQTLHHGNQPPCNIMSNYMQVHSKPYTTEINSHATLCRATCRSTANLTPRKSTPMQHYVVLHAGPQQTLHHGNKPPCNIMSCYMQDHKKPYTTEINPHATLCRATCRTTANLTPRKSTPMQHYVMLHAGPQQTLHHGNQPPCNIMSCYMQVHSKPYTTEINLHATLCRATCRTTRNLTPRKSTPMQHYVVLHAGPQQTLHHRNKPPCNIMSCYMQVHSKPYTTEINLLATLCCATCRSTANLTPRKSTPIQHYVVLHAGPQQTLPHGKQPPCNIMLCYMQVHSKPYTTEIKPHATLCRATCRSTANLTPRKSTPIQHYVVLHAGPQQTLHQGNQLPCNITSGYMQVHSKPYTTEINRHATLCHATRRSTANLTPRKSTPMQHYVVLHAGPQQTLHHGNQPPCNIMSCYTQVHSKPYTTEINPHATLCRATRRSTANLTPRKSTKEYLLSQERRDSE